MKTTLEIIETLKNDLLSNLSDDSRSYADQLLSDIPDDRETKQDIIQAALYALEDGEYLQKLFNTTDEEEEEENEKIAILIEEIYDALKALTHA
jgi:hypothetical protein